MTGWIKIYRSLCEWEWFTSPQTLQLFIYILLNANHLDKKWHGLEIKRGQFITSRSHLSQATGLTQQEVRTCLNRLKSTSTLTSTSTSKFTIITVCNFDSYQGDDSGNQPALQPALQPASNQQATSKQPQLKNIKNEIRKEVNKLVVDLNFVEPDFIPFVEEWIEYRKDLGKPFKTTKGVKAFYNKLVDLSGGDTAVARKIVDNAVAAEHQSIYPISKETKTNHKTQYHNGKPIYAASSNWD